MSSLPEEIDLDILMRVPVKSLVICKYVCKSWFSIILDPDFVKEHLKRTALRKNYRLMIKGYGNSCYSISHDSLSSSNESDDFVAVVETDFPYKSSEHRTELLGSCNGLVYGRNHHMELFFLWNPSTKEYKTLPKSSSYGRHAFGYDYKTDDYKLVNIHILTGLTEIYSLKANSWKISKSSHYDQFSLRDCGVFFKGALHWFGRVTYLQCKTIVSMNISEERFLELQLPITQYYQDIGVLEECLCVLAPIAKLETCEVWVMKDYGVPESWTKLYTITYGSIMCDSLYKVTFIWSFKDGEYLFEDAKRGIIILYDLKYGTARKLNIGLKVRDAVSYFESLVSLNTITSGVEETGEKSLEI